ncbi:uncharacterized protein [Elaeis guineensis]|uniref:uncharacterized protein n=1 Tax=Elaeis guineensis var. tenera TaxID=51953 RepID=UPI003C6D0C05
MAISAMKRGLRAFRFTYSLDKTLPRTERVRFSAHQLRGVVTEHALRFDFKASNNQAEYEALVAGLKLALELGIDRLKVFSDSQLIVGQIKDEFETRDPTMAKYHQKVKDLMAPFGYFGIFHIPRAENARADALSRLAMSDFGALGRTFVQNLERSSIDEVEEVLQLATGPS